MKMSVLRVLSLMLALLSVVASLASCAGSMPLTIAKKGESKYQIVYANGDRDAANAANHLAAELKELTEAELTVTDDRTEADKKVPEILVGRTNRGIELEVQRTLLYGEYLIAREGKNVYILGAGSGMLDTACKDFLEEVLTEKFKVSGKGELLRSERARYDTGAVTLNGKAITDYTVLIPAGSSALKWDDYVPYVEGCLTLLSGNLLTTATYEDVNDLPYTPAIVLNGSAEGLGKAEYKIEVSGDNIILSAGSDKAAMALAISFMDKLSVSSGDSVALQLTARGGKAGENALTPLTEGSDIRVMTYNIYATTKDHKNAMPYVSASILAYAPDFVCLQECPAAGELPKLVFEDTKAAGYELAGGTFNQVSPTALENAGTDANYDRFAYVGGQSYTPILYRADRWEVVEDGSYLYYWKNRYHMTNTKSLSYGVFKDKATGELVLVIGTHFPLMAAAYAGQGDAYCSYSGTDATVGAAWRDGTTQEILKLVDAMRVKYPGILTTVMGDMNARATERSMTTMEAHAILSNASVMAPAGMKSTGASFHDYGKAPGATGGAIDHIFVSEDVAAVTRHAIIGDALTVQGSDHCPVVADIARK